MKLCIIIYSFVHTNYCKHVQTISFIKYHKNHTYHTHRLLRRVLREDKQINI